MKILGVETSCDETAAAVIEAKTGRTQNFVFVRSNIVSSQIEIHKKYGGVVPEVAAREHVLNILPVINEALEKAGIPHPALILSKERVPERRVRLDAIAVTTGPGLITSLQVGVETAKALAYAWKIPTIGVNHIEGHIYANFISENPKSQIPNPKFFTRRSFSESGPILILTVSGGHTMLVLMRGHGKYKIIGDTLDDAAGEAFDKAAKLMGIGYPGGPVVAAEASKIRNPKSEIRNLFLPRPMINSKDYNFSFSGLKTALFYQLKKDKGWKKRMPEYCYEFQQAVIDVLIYKTIKAAQEFNVKAIFLSGGVAANKELRRQMAEKIKEKVPKIEFKMPNLEYTTDNAVMVAAAGYYKFLRKDFTPFKKLNADCNLALN